MGQQQGVERPSKFKIKMQSMVGGYLIYNGPKKKVHWQAVLKEIDERQMDLDMFWDARLRRLKKQKRV